jgi:hypothetical protein
VSADSRAWLCTEFNTAQWFVVLFAARESCVDIAVPVSGGDAFRRHPRNISAWSVSPLS